MILRHKDTQEAFNGYDFNTTTPSTATKRKSERKEFEPFTHTTMSIRRKK